MKPADMSVGQLEARLAEIETDLAAIHSTDFAEVMQEAILAGGDLDAVEDQQAQAERRAKRLETEAAALESFVPKARVIAYQPRIDDIHAAEAKLVSDGAKAAQKVLKALGELTSAMEQYQAASSAVYHDIRAMKVELSQEAGLRIEDMGMSVHDGLKHAELCSKLADAKGELSQWVMAADDVDLMQKRVGITKLDAQ